MWTHLDTYRNSCGNAYTGLSIHRPISLFCQLRGSRSKEHTWCPDLGFWGNYSGKGTSDPWRHAPTTGAGDRGD